MLYREDNLITLQRDLQYDYIITGPPDFAELDIDTKDIQSYYNFMFDRFSLFKPKSGLVTLIFTNRKADKRVIHKQTIFNDIMSKNNFDLISEKVWVKTWGSDVIFRLGFVNILTWRHKKNERTHSLPLMPDCFYYPQKRSDNSFPPQIIGEFIKGIPGVVYDPFMGSGTTANVCNSLGREWIGSEWN
jgi:DNA modification methylase